MLLALPADLVLQCLAGSCSAAAAAGRLVEKNPSLVVGVGFQSGREDEMIEGAYLRQQAAGLRRCWRRRRGVDPGRSSG